ncbi:hypothetical protein GCM10011588_31300 [Nocardia jinanensis]|uniref:Uncharacterized protein n=1 Tax=Nocardia jinanensis TaxID=382504 RepID=A0A917VU09_9NOCA|nr:hypothetical protein GCM10011588_31300 [Nocardia jinanensis]
MVRAAIGYLSCQEEKGVHCSAWGQAGQRSADEEERNEEVHLSPEYGWSGRGCIEFRVAPHDGIH